MEKFKLIIKRIGNKIKKSYDAINKKAPYIESILIISGSLLVVLLVIVAVIKPFNKEVSTTYANKAEVAFYNNNYEQAIAEYENMQKGEKWPFYQVKIAEIYSIKGDIEKSNKLLKDSIVQRDEILEDKNREEYDVKDRELVNYVVFTYFMNEEYEEALSLGEKFIRENGEDKTLMRTMFAVYMANGQKDRAKEMVDMYDIDKESSYDLALIAEMNMLIGNWDKGFNLLNEAFIKDRNEIKIQDVIGQFATYDNEEIEKKLKDLINNNPEVLSYKIWLAKVYSMRPETANLANDIIKGIKGEEAESISVNLIKADTYKSMGNALEANAVLDDIINKNEDSFISYYISAWKNFKEGNFDKALELSKESIVKNKEYPNSYGILIPEIMMTKGESQISEGYFRTALQKEPFNYNIMIKLGEYYASTSIQNEKAREYYNLASTISPNDSEVYYDIAKLDISDNKINEAIVNLNKAIEKDSTVAKYYRTLGTIYFNEENYDSAIENIRAAYAEDENDALTLNNAGCYYILVEEDIERGMSNIQSAYDEINSNMNEQTKNIIIGNYNKVKALYGKYNTGNEAELEITELNLF